MKRVYRLRRTMAIIILAAGLLGAVVFHPDAYSPIPQPSLQEAPVQSRALEELQALAVKGRAPKTNYSREQFGGGWNSSGGCDTRNIILNRDLIDVVVNQECKVISGTLKDPYTAKTIQFTRGELSSQAIQIDHVVALSNAWQTGAQQLSPERREELANDPLELLAVDGAANQQKSASDAATWLPSNKAFRCQYVARQIAVKKKYSLWVTAPEKEAMARVLSVCPGQSLPIR